MMMLKWVNCYYIDYRDSVAEANDLYVLAFLLISIAVSTSRFIVS